MSRIRPMGLVALALAGACAAPAQAVRAKTPVPVVESRLSADVTRLAEIAQIDVESQEQLVRVDALAARVAALQAELAGALSQGASQREAKATVAGQEVRVRLSDDLMFAAGSARITRRGRVALERVAEVLRRSPVERVEVAGHTDNAPIARKYVDNWDLSMTRARAVVVYLIAHEVEPRQLRLVAYADTQPLAREDSNEARTRNRRVELLIAPEVVAQRTAARAR